jgi:ABC-type amino acid transport system permease subunit
MHYHWDLAMVLADTDRWWHGIGITLLYSVTTVAGGIVIGVFCGLDCSAKSAGSPCRSRAMSRSSGARRS